MPCWVSPNIAADLLGITLDELMARMEAGGMPSRTEDGRTLVDVAPESDRRRPQPHQHPRRRRRSRARPFAIQSEPLVTAAEMRALHGDQVNVPDEPAHITDDESGPAGDPDPETDPIFPEDGPPLHWQQARARVALTRKPPGQGIATI